nr:hypothetical protein [Runella sp.]
MSDNGLQGGKRKEKALYNAGLRGTKGSVYEGGVRPDGPLANAVPQSGQ